MADVTPIAAKAQEQREARLRRLLDAMNDNDVEASLACFDHPRYELIGNQRVYDGAEEVRHYYEVSRRYFPDLCFEVIEVHHSDTTVVCELWMSGTHLGSGPDFEATGRRFRCRTATIFVFDGDRLTGARVYYDTGTVARQLA